LWCVGLGGAGETVEMCIGVDKVLASGPEGTCPSRRPTSCLGRCVDSPRSFKDVGLVGKAVRRGAGAVSAWECSAERLEAPDSVIFLGCKVTAKLRRRFVKNVGGRKPPERQTPQQTGTRAMKGCGGQNTSDVASCCRLVDCWAIGIVLGDASITEIGPPSRCGRGTPQDSIGRRWKFVGRRGKEYRCNSRMRGCRSN
jgi:hypothetical protein